MNLFDATTWIGRWPFSFQPAHTAKSLAAHLRRQGIKRALVSPLDAALAPSPGPANRELLRKTRGLATLIPVPVINPSLGDWREELAAAAADARVRAIRLLPNYHGYRLGSRRVDEFVAALRAARLALIVQVRLIDERHEYHGMNLKPVRTRELEQLLSRRRDCPVLACGLTRGEFRRLMPAHPNLLSDTSFLEWHDTVRDALTVAPADRIVFGSHTPFFMTAASRAKVITANVPARIRSALGERNLRRFLA